MSYPVDCPACIFGNHDGHDPNHGIVEGLIGGTSCNCTGDCKERADEDAKTFAKWWNATWK